MVVFQDPSQACSDLWICLLYVFLDHSFCRYLFGHLISLLHETPLLAFGQTMYCTQLGLGLLCLEPFGAHIPVICAMDNTQEYGAAGGVCQLLCLSQ